MRLMKITAAFAAASLAACMSISASAATELTRTDSVNKFDLGTDSVGGSGVEGDKTAGQNWIKVVQNSNSLKLFEDVGPDVNVTALAVTFEISDWSGIEFPVSWGANIDFWDDASTTWCGTGAFEGISEYTVNSNGEYTLVCNLQEMADARGKEGIAHMQTCEMVLNNVPENDTTTIEVKSARIYVDGEAVENAVLPDGTEISITNRPVVTDTDESGTDDSSQTDSGETAEEKGDDTAAETSDDSSTADSGSEDTQAAAEGSDGAEAASAESGESTDKSGSTDTAADDTKDTAAADSGKSSTDTSTDKDITKDSSGGSSSASSSGSQSSSSQSSGNPGSSGSSTGAASSNTSSASAGSTAAGSTADKGEPDNTNAETGAAENLMLAGMALGIAGAIASKKKK